jgi:hypothetical protein
MESVGFANGMRKNSNVRSLYITHIILFVIVRVSRVIFATKSCLPRGHFSSHHCAGMRHQNAIAMLIAGSHKVPSPVGFGFLKEARPLQGRSAGIPDHTKEKRYGLCVPEHQRWKIQRTWISPYPSLAHGLVDVPVYRPDG